MSFAKNASCDVSDKEESEIADELGELSDISSDEEYLLRLRLQVLENYNNVLERKQGKSGVQSGTVKHRGVDSLWYDFPEISATGFDKRVLTNTAIKKENKRQKNKLLKEATPLHHKVKRKENILHRNKNFTKKNYNKKKEKVKHKIKHRIISESSEEEDDKELKIKRRRLADAVTINKKTQDKSSLKSRLMNMTASGIKASSPKRVYKLQNDIKKDIVLINGKSDKMNNVKTDTKVEKNDDECVELIDLCADDEDVTITNENIQENTVLETTPEEKKGLQIPKTVSDSDEDLDMLRQFALNTKSTKTELDSNEDKVQYDGEDSDTKELRLICLKSALLKKAIEMKRKQKLQKRLSQSNFEDTVLTTGDLTVEQYVDNNTDIESVDMDTDISDGPEINENDKIELINEDKENQTISLISKEEEIEEDEDLLRAKLLMSLSNKLPKLISTDTTNASSNTVPKVKSIKDVKSSSTGEKVVTDEKRFIINTKDSDSGSDEEAIKNLTKMHNKLAPVDFQQRLDLFLKSTRMQVEQDNLGNVIQEKSVTLKPQEKYIPKVVNHLPKSEQIEYKNLVKRMAELEKIKAARQQMVDSIKIIVANTKDPMKQRNVFMDGQDFQRMPNIEDQIQLSRKKIAEESAKMLQIKEDGTKLLQKFKMVSTELRNLSTAITFNKRQYRQTQTKLSKMRSQHQMLLKISSKNLDKKVMLPPVTKSNHTAKINMLSSNPIKEAPVIYSNKNETKSTLEPLKATSLDSGAVKENRDNVDINNGHKAKQKDILVNNLNLDCLNNKIVQYNKDNIHIKVSTTNIVIEKDNDSSIEINDIKDQNEVHVISNINSECLDERIDDGHDYIVPCAGIKMKTFDDYQSPLQAILSIPWNEDPHGVLCPFEVAGICKDASCHYLHPKLPPTHP